MALIVILQFYNEYLLTNKLELDSGQRIDFRYEAVLSILFEAGSMPALIISMMEAPRFFETIVSDPVADLLAQLDIAGSPRGQRKKGADRHRVPCLSEQVRNLFFVLHTISHSSRPIFRSGT